MGKKMVRKSLVCLLRLLISKAKSCILFSVMALCLSFAAVGWPAESGTLAGLRERVAILDQARVKAAAELTGKEQQGGVTSRDRQHYQTVVTFLEQQIADACLQLIEKGGAAAVLELPCPASTVARQENEEKKFVEESEGQPGEKQQEEVITEAEPSPAAVPVKKENIEKMAVPQQPPAPGVMASIRRWLESLFMPKPPPSKSGSETERSPEQKDDTTAAKQNSRQSTEPEAQSVEQGTESNNEESGKKAGSRKQQENSAGGEGTLSEEEAGEQKQGEQQLDNGEKLTAEQRSEQTAGQEKNTSKKGGNRAETDQNRQEGEQGQGSKGKNIADGAVEKGSSQTGDGSTKDPFESGSSSAATGDRESDDTTKRGGGQGTGQKDATAQKAPSQVAAQSIPEEETSQPAPAPAGSDGKEDTAHGAQGAGGPPPVVDTEVSRLEASLNEALEEFDGQLLNEQERLAARTPKQREGSTAGSGGYGAQAPPGPGGYGSLQGDTGNGRHDPGGQRQPGGVAAGGGKAAPAGGKVTLDHDDDIVARQLREAAEKETDPVLQEKLWQEYRKYKRAGG